MAGPPGGHFNQETGPHPPPPPKKKQMVARFFLSSAAVGADGSGMHQCMPEVRVNLQAGGGDILWAN